MQHHVFIGNLVTKTKDLFMTSKVNHYYILFSSKSLYPD